MAFFSIKPDRDRPAGWQILEIADIPFYVEPSFLFIIVIVLMYQAQASQSLAQGGLLAFIIFFSLLVHEGGHAIVSRLFGLKPITVSLVAFGGYTRHPPTTHGRSLAIVAAGPLGTLLMAGLGLTLPYLFPSLRQYEATDFVCGNLLFINVFWFFFNVLPIYPMDGGQGLFHLFSFVVREPRALLYVAYLSLATCGIVGYWVFSSHNTNLMILMFLFMFFMQNLEIVRSLNRL